MMLGLFEVSRCLVCDGEVDSPVSWRDLILPEKEAHLCKPCQSKLEPIKGETCAICGRPLQTLEPQFHNGHQCSDCTRWEEDRTYKGVLTQNSSLYLYNDFLKEVIAKYKYRGDYVLAKLFAQEIKSKIKEIKPDHIVPIPLSPERLYERGFNQAEGLIKESGHQPTHLLTRIHSEKQSKKSRNERIHLAQVFQTTQAIKGKILLVDDIYTTGSTLRHAARLLITSGAATVQSLTIARG